MFCALLGIGGKGGGGLGWGGCVMYTKNLLPVCALTALRCSCSSLALRFVLRSANFVHFFRESERGKVQENGGGGGGGGGNV